MTSLATLAARTFADLLDDAALDRAIENVTCSGGGMARLYLAIRSHEPSIDRLTEKGVTRHLRDCFHVDSDQKVYDLKAILLDLFQGERRVRMLKRQRVPAWVRSDYDTPVVEIVT